MTIINRSAGTLEAPRKPLGLYLHIPFCIRKCNYCDFLSFGDVPAEDRAAYAEALVQEIRYNGNVYGNKYYVDTIFIGGGTPSLVEEPLIEGIMAAVSESFCIARNAEISIEANPGTLTGDKLTAWRKAGINRLSIGVQSLDDNLLESMGRAHTAGDFLRNYTLARECGFENINIDLMFGIPGQTPDTWMETLDRIVGLGPEHISFYSLQLEEGTPFFELFYQGSLQPADDETDRSMYHKASKTLKESGYTHYEISNAAVDGYVCRHNLKYWSMEDYLGLGLGSHSFLEGIRSGNLTDLSRYIRIGMKEGSLSQEPDSPYLAWRHKNTQEENISEYLITGMRRLEGIDLIDFRIRFGRRLEDVFPDNWQRIQKYMDEKYLININETLRFSEKGIDISNAILTEFV